MQIKNEQAQDGAATLLIASRRGSSKNAQLTAQLKAVIKDCLRLYTAFDTPNVS